MRWRPVASLNRVGDGGQHRHHWRLIANKAGATRLPGYPVVALENNAGPLPLLATELALLPALAWRAAAASRRRSPLASAASDRA
jgi:hypothetical protein